jgi:CRP-like cAMP-binding protein
VRATYADPSSGAMLFEDAGPGEVFGLAIAISGSEGSRAASMSLAAERSTEILAVDSESLRLLVQETPALAKNLMSYFARKLSGVSSQQEDASPERRVYAALLSFVQRDAVAAEWRIPKMPKHKELAQSADVDEAEAAAAVAKLIQSGVARRDYPGVVIEDMASLNRLAR